MFGEMFGALMNYKGVSETNAANARMANEQQHFQEHQSNTAWQRGVADLKAAGLNPALAYSQGPASAQQGVSIPSENPWGAASESLSRGVSSALEYRRLGQDLKMQQSNIDLNEASAAATSANARQANANADILEENLKKAKSTGKFYDKMGDFVPFIQLIRGGNP